MISIMVNNMVFGGVERLAVTLAQAMCLRKISFKFIAPSDSQQWKMVVKFADPSMMYDFHLHADQGFRNVICNDDTLIIFNPRLYPVLIKNNPKVLYWNIHPASLRLHKGSIWSCIINVLQRLFLIYMKGHGGLYMMDEAWLALLRQHYNIKIKSPSYLPIPIPIPRDTFWLPRGNHKSSGLRLLNLGRAIDWKIHPFIWALNRIAAQSKIVTVHIVSDNTIAYRKLVKKYCSSDLNKLIIYHESIYDNALTNIMTQNVDIALSMGTAALESAAVGVPTILLDAFSVHDRGSGVNYQWLYETNYFCLGRDLDLDIKKNNRSGRDMALLLKEYQQDPLLVSQNCRKYICDNHDPNVVVDRLVSASNQTSARFNLIKYMFVPNMIKYRYKRWKEKNGREL